VGPPLRFRLGRRSSFHFINRISCGPVDYKLEPLSTRYTASQPVDLIDPLHAWESLIRKRN